MIIENIVEICIAIDIAILGIAYPIIIDKISNIGEKYSSQYIQVLFNNEFPQKSTKITFKKKEYKISFFKLALFVTISSFIFIIFRFPPLFGWDNWIVNNSAELVVFTLTATLVILFFIWLGKVALYTGQSKSIVTHLIKTFDKLKANAEIQNYHLKAINELTLYAIEKQDEHLQETLLEFYSQLFANIRSNQDISNPLVYPVDLYFLVYKLNEIAAEKGTKLRAIEHRAVSGVWLNGEGFNIDSNKISEETYSWLWQNIYTICDKYHLVKMFWANSIQIMNYNLKPIYPIYDNQSQILNKDEIDNRNEERKRFFEFHYALGGLMLYRGQYKTLKYMFEYTQSQPPNYVLFPNDMTSIFEWFIHFNDESKHWNNPIEYKYYFHELDNLGNSRQISHWISCYISLLFLRQYSLHEYYVYQNHTDQSALPDGISELSGWLENTPYFQKCIESVLSNEDLIFQLGFTKLIDEKGDSIRTFATDLENRIKDKIRNTKLNAQLSKGKLANFRAKSNEIISAAFRKYDNIFIPSTDDHLKGKLKLGINGTKTLTSKSNFTDGDIPHLNYDSFIAESIVLNRIKREIPLAFPRARTKRYLFNRENVLLALDRIINGNKDIVIIPINLDWKTYEIIINSETAKVINIPPTGDDNTLFVLRKSDLPAIEHKPLSSVAQNESQLIEINADIHLSASVIDINTNDNREIKDKWNSDNRLDSEDLKVEVNIAFLSIIHWKDNREVIQVSIASEYKEQGIQNELNDIIPIANYEPTRITDNRI